MAINHNHFCISDKDLCVLAVWATKKEGNKQVVDRIVERINACLCCKIKWLMDFKKFIGKRRWH